MLEPQLLRAHPMNDDDPVAMPEELQLHYGFLWLSFSYVLPRVHDGVFPRSGRTMSDNPQENGNSRCHHVSKCYNSISYQYILFRRFQTWGFIAMALNYHKCIESLCVAAWVVPCMKSPVNRVFKWLRSILTIKRKLVFPTCVCDGLFVVATGLIRYLVQKNTIAHRGSTLKGLLNI